MEIKNRFLASAAHDIRQPVHALGLYADWLGSEPELVHEIAPKIVESTKAVNALFDSLFDLVRLDSGKIKLNIEPVDLRRAAARPGAAVPAARRRPRACSSACTSRRGTVVSDPILLRRIVGNLVSNAIKYTQQRRRAARGARARATAGASKCGTPALGIAPVHQREIFREFYKVPEPRAAPRTASGWGCTSCAAVARSWAIRFSLASRPGARHRVPRDVLKADRCAGRPARARAAARLGRLSCASMP